MEKIITIPRNLTKDELVIITKESLKELNKENLELKGAIHAILDGELALGRGKTRTFRQFLASKYSRYAQNI